MNPLRTLFFVACLAAATMAMPKKDQQQQQQSFRSNAVGGGQLKPTTWLSPSELESLPSVDEITFQELENMTPQEGADLIEKMYHVSQIGQKLMPTFVPNPNEIQVSIMKPNGENVTTTLAQLPEAAKQQENFGDDEVTIFLTGYPQKTETIRKATRKLVQAYTQRYNVESQKKKSHEYEQEHPYQRWEDKDGKNKDDEDKSSSEEENEKKDDSTHKRWTGGDLIVIDLGSSLKNLANIVTLDVDRTGAMIADKLLEIAEENNVPEEIIHVVAQGPAAHVAGVAGRHYQRHTGRALRRITGLDPSKLYAKKPNTLTGLARGDADFVDVIHTSAYGLGTPKRCGDVDFFPNGPSASPPGADNIVEASMRATRYFAESVRPGNERNFPAVNANSLMQYKNNNGHGKRAYMGIATDFDLDGDFMLQVNPTSPFGQSTPAQLQNTYHAVRQGWRNRHGQDYD